MTLEWRDYEDTPMSRTKVEIHICVARSANKTWQWWANGIMGLADKYELQRGVNYPTMEAAKEDCEKFIREMFMIVEE